MKALLTALGKCMFVSGWLFAIIWFTGSKTNSGFILGIDLFSLYILFSLLLLLNHIYLDGKGLSLYMDGEYDDVEELERSRLSELEDELAEKTASLEERERKFLEEQEALQSESLELQKRVDNLSTVLSNMEKAVSNERRELNAIVQRKTALEREIEILGRTEFRLMDYCKQVERAETVLMDTLRKKAEKIPVNAPCHGQQFEKSFSEFLAEKSFENIVVTQSSGDFGADILAEKDSVKYAIQCKYYASTVGVEAVQQVLGAKSHYDAHLAVVATNSVFTKAAQILADDTGVILWDGDTIKSMGFSLETV